MNRELVLPEPRKSGLKGNELVRKLYHISAGGLAFLLRYLSWHQTLILAVVSILLNVLVVPFVGGRRWFWRANERTQGYSHGILLYTGSVLVLVLVFHDAPWMTAAIWGVLAFGDGMSGIVGQAFGGRRLPWNAKKSWAGSIAFVVFGGVAAAVLLLWTADPALGLNVGRACLLGFLLALVCGAVESLPSRLDDNVTIPLAGAISLPLLTFFLPLSQSAS